MSEPIFNGLAIKVVSSTGNVYSRTAMSLCRSLVELSKLNVPVELAIVTQTEGKDEAQNLSCAQFLETEFSHLLLIKDGMVWEPTDIIRLIRAKKNIIGGVHVEPTEETRFRLSPKVDEESKAKVEKNCLEVEFVGAEFILVTRHSLQVMRDGFDPETAFQAPNNDGHISIYPWFRKEVRDGKLVSSDYIFCESWKNTGGHTWVEVSAAIERVAPASYRETIDKLLVLSKQA